MYTYRTADAHPALTRASMARAIIRDLIWLVPPKPQKPPAIDFSLVF
jgi:hypothetical protein